VTATYSRGGIVMMAMSALDIVLGDAVGMRAGLLLHRLWGHFRSQIPAHGSGCFRGSGMIENHINGGHRRIAPRTSRRD
jgi:L-alanine-DL-glutamate epimerase-like enolase superfamily enzyme